VGFAGSQQIPANPATDPSVHEPAPIGVATPHNGSSTRAHGLGPCCCIDVGASEAHRCPCDRVSQEEPTVFAKAGAGEARRCPRHRINQEEAVVFLLPGQEEEGIGPIIATRGRETG